MRKKKYPILSRIWNTQKDLKSFRLTLEKKRTRGDLIYMFTIAKGIENIDSKISHGLIEPKTRGHDYRFSRENFKQKFLMNRVAPL